MKVDRYKEWMSNWWDLLKLSQELTLHPVLCVTALSRNCTWIIKSQFKVNLKERENNNFPNIKVTIWMNALLIWDNLLRREMLIKLIKLKHRKITLSVVQRHGKFQNLDTLLLLTEFCWISQYDIPESSFRVPSVTGYHRLKIRRGKEVKRLSLDLLRITVSSIKENYHYLLDLLNPEIHSSKNSKVRCGSLAASVLLIETINRVLLAGIHKPDVSSNWPSIFKLKVQVKAHRRL